MRRSIPSTIAFCSNDLSTRTVSAASFSTGFDRTSPDVLSASATTVLRRKPLSFSTEFRRVPSLAQCYSCSIPRMSFVSPPSMVSVHTRTPMIFKYMIMRCKRPVQVWWLECRPVSWKSVIGWPVTVSNSIRQRRSWYGWAHRAGRDTARQANKPLPASGSLPHYMSGTWAWWSMVSLQWGLMSATSPAPVSTICVNYVWWGGVSQRTPLTPLWEPWCTVVSTTVTVSSPVFPSIRSTSYSPFSVHRPDSCWSYQDRPVSPTWCGTSSIGFQCHSESSSSFVAPSSNVSTALHHPTYPSFVNRSPPSPVVISFDQLPLEIF